MSTSIEQLPNIGSQTQQPQQMQQMQPQQQQQFQSPGQSPQYSTQSLNQNKNFVENPNQISSENMNSIIGDIKQTGLNNIPLPQRDIPNDSVQHISVDNTSRTNFIKEEPQEDYIREYENLDIIQQNAIKEDNTNTYDEYIPYGFAAGLYVILQMPQIRTILRKHVPGLFTSEGEAQMSYHVLLGLFFSVVFYIANKYVL